MTKRDYIALPLSDIEDMPFLMYPISVFDSFINGEDLTYLEYRTLQFIIRMTNGFAENHGKRRIKARLSLANFCDGIVCDNGNVLVPGLNCTKSSVCKALGKLKSLGLVVQLINDKDQARIKIEYQLRTQSQYTYFFNGELISDFYYFPEAHSNEEHPRLPVDCLRNAEILKDERVVTYCPTGQRALPYRTTGIVLQDNWHCPTGHIVHKKDILRKKVFTHCGVCVGDCTCSKKTNQVQSNGSTKPQKTPRQKSQKTKSTFDVKAAQHLATTIESISTLNKNQSVRSWEKDFRLLREQDGASKELIRQILEWYRQIVPKQERYTPVVRSGKAFREKFFDKLVPAYERWCKTSGVVLKVKRAPIKVRPIELHEIDLPRLCLDDRSYFDQDFAYFFMQECNYSMERVCNNDPNYWKREFKAHEPALKAWLQKRINDALPSLSKIQLENSGLSFLIQK